MHEMGILVMLAEQVAEIAKANHASHVTTVTIEIGKISGIIPYYLKKYYPIIIENDPLLQDSELIIYETPAEAICQNCKTLYDIKKYSGLCPTCGSRRRTVIRGEEFILKNIEIETNNTDQKNH